MSYSTVKTELVCIVSLFLCQAEDYLFSHGYEIDRNINWYVIAVNYIFYVKGDVESNFLSHMNVAP